MNQSQQVQMSVTFIQQKLTIMQPDLRQAVCNIFHFLKQSHAEKSYPYFFAPVMEIQDWTGYENAVLFEEQHRAGMINVFTQLLTGINLPSSHRVDLPRYTDLLTLLEHVFGDMPVAIAFPPHQLVTTVGENIPMATNLVRILDYLDDHGLNIEVIHNDPIKAYCIARSVFTGENGFSVPHVMDLNKLSERPYVQTFVEAINLYYTLINQFGTVSTEGGEVVFNRKLNQIEEVVDSAIRRALQPMSGMGMAVPQGMGGIFGGFNGGFNMGNFMNTGGHVPKSEVINKLLQFPIQGYEEETIASEFNISKFIAHLTPAQRFQVFKLAYKVNSYGLEEYRELANLVRVGQVGLCNYLFPDVDNTVMREAILTLGAVKHDSLITGEGAFDTQVNNDYLWLTDIFNLITNYYDDLTVFVTEEPVEESDECAVNEDPRFASYYLDKLDSLTEVEVVKSVTQINKMLSNEDWVNRNMTYDSMNQSVSIVVPIDPIGTVVLTGVMDAMNKQGWLCVVPLNLDFDGDQERSRFAVRLNAKR